VLGKAQAVNSVALKPCPICGDPPDRFTVSERRIDVIACRRGCKPNWNHFIVHITSDQVEPLAWGDLGEAWNTIQLYTDEEGVRRISFDRFPGQEAPFEIWGPYFAWSPAISQRRVAERRAATNPTS
jgi:hypothetical protein